MTLVPLMVIGWVVHLQEV